MKGVNHMRNSYTNVEMILPFLQLCSAAFFNCEFLAYFVVLVGV